MPTPERVGTRPYARGIRVIPVLKGRKTDRLNVEDLPAELARLADVQSLRLDTRDNRADLARIGDEFAKLVQSLKDVEQAATRSPAPETVRNSVDEAHGTVVQSRDITGDVGTIVKESHGPVHTGKGDINQNSQIYKDSQHFTGAWGTYVKGDNHGGIRHQSGGSYRGEDGR
jgi:hypothetical protein